MGMDGAIRDLWACARAPRPGFRARAARRPELRAALLGLLRIRTLPTLALLALGYLALVQGYDRARNLDGPLWSQLASRLPEGVGPTDLRAALAVLPALPGLARVLPGLVLVAPLGVLSLWLHDAVWDHLALWLLRGLAGPHSLRTTLVADAEALQVGVFGALAGLLPYLLGSGLLWTALLLPVALYFWVLRGFALAAWHGCPVWKGVLATLLHGLLMGVLVFGSLGLFVLTVFQQLRM
jgi:hypothetical protein